MCINKENCKRNLVPTKNYSKYFGRIFICENCKRYYSKIEDDIIEVSYIEPQNEWVDSSSF